MEDWLQSGLPDDYDDRKCLEGKKRVNLCWSNVTWHSFSVLLFFFNAFF